MADGIVKRDRNRGRFYAEKIKKSKGTWLIVRQVLLRVYGDSKSNKNAFRLFFHRVTE
ncbi:helix-turn-helix domain-containing protein [Bacillus sp. 123MFChir2]|uniref:helix-turn-helix domain-containing protein n=1 Tax=Bacillus sp. 123MFChir2 TaxID=1169144 RepID=UPI0003722B3D